MKKHKPFFERFLENQRVLSTEEANNILAGEIRETLKWPSDNDEPIEGGQQQQITTKYPSDSDEAS